MISQQGIPFTVTNCTEHGRSQYLIKGTLHESDDITPVETDLYEVDCGLLQTGVLLPKIGWEITSMPGFQPPRELNYANTYIPPPRRAWCGVNATVDNLVFSKGREWRDPLATDARPISTEDFHAASIMSNRLIDLDHYAQRVNALKEAAKKATG